MEKALQEVLTDDNEKLVLALTSIPRMRAGQLVAAVIAPSGRGF